MSPPRTGTGTVPKLAGEDAYATKGSRFLGKTRFSK